MSSRRTKPAPGATGWVVVKQGKIYVGEVIYRSMRLAFDFVVAQNLERDYRSRSQFGGRLAESWANENLYCVRCGNVPLEQAAPNTPVHDYECRSCAARFQLKAKKGPIGSTIRNSEYNVKIASIKAKRNPSYLFLRYDLERLMVRDLIAVPRHFITPAVVKGYPPLSSKARRAGWRGSALLLGVLPPEARIPVVKDFVESPKSTVLEIWSRFSRLETESLSTRGWVTEVLSCVRRIEASGASEFVNEDLYRFEEELSVRYPANLNIRPKIRQKLQDLERAGVIRRIEAGRYRIVG